MSKCGLIQRFLHQPHPCFLKNEQGVKSLIDLLPELTIQARKQLELDAYCDIVTTIDENEMFLTPLRKVLLIAGHT